LRGGVVLSSEAFIQILQHALNEDIVTVNKRKGKYIVKKKEADAK
jgi:hypothetical protein